MQELTTKQQRFVECYLIAFNGTQAAIEAGYSEKTARSISCELLTKPDIRSAIKKQLEQLSSDSYVSREVILTGLLKEAMGTGENSTPTSRVNAWSQLGKLSGLYTDTKPQASVDDIIRDITARNAASRTLKGLLPKNHINFDDLPTLN
ncbi:MAG TPA: terminase small subunit [Colwellia sp.]|nr:terminase small subunit [Colwellia sp.]|tara:strand:- start:2081 stop:2527 length:447 start_codon:yes stop_codon:yes gene_type:complete